MVIRKALESDAIPLIALGRRVLADRSTLHLLRDGENIDTFEDQKDLIQWYGAAPNRCLLVAEHSPSQLVGQVTAFGGTYTADQGTAVLIVEVDPAFRRQGIATHLLSEIENWAKEKGLHRLELTVLSDNIPALRLYEKCGFIREGRKVASRQINRQFLDEYVMAKLLPPFFNSAPSRDRQPGMIAPG